MSQTNKLFLVLLVLFIIFATMKGTLVVYLRTLFGPACKGTTITSAPNANPGVGAAGIQALAAAGAL